MKVLGREVSLCIMLRQLEQLNAILHRCQRKDRHTVKSLQRVVHLC